MIPVLKVDISYKYPARFGDTIVINTKIKEFKGVHLVMSYVITKKGSNELVAVAETKHCSTDTNVKPINLKKKM